jgi:membrane protein
VAGPQIADLLAGWFGFGTVFTMTWKVLQWPIAFALITTGTALVYYYAPDAEQDFTWITPGSVIAATLWVIASLLFRVYVVGFGNYEATYGTVTGVILLMLWFYISGLMLIIGAEAAAEIEHASPWGKAPGEKVPGNGRRSVLLPVVHLVPSVSRNDGWAQHERNYRFRRSFTFHRWSQLPQKKWRDA